MVKLGLPVLGAIPSLPSEEAVVDGVLYAGTLMSAISGVISAGTKQMDMLGCIIVGCITAMAGGTLRDVVLNRPPFWITYPSHLHAAVWGSLATFVLWPLIINHSAFKDTHLAFLWSDALARDVAFYTTTRSQESPPDLGQCLWRICPELDYSAAEKLTATTLKIRGLAAAGAAKGRFAGTSTWGG